MIVFFSVAEKKKVSLSDDSKIQLLYPNHVRIIVGDLSDGFAAAGDESDEDESVNSSDEEVEDDPVEACWVC